MKGSSTVQDREGRIELISFGHGVNLPVDNANGRITGARTPRFRLKKSLMQQRPIFTRPWRRGKRLTSAEIKWYRINDAGKEEVYFAMTLEGGKVCGISPGMANTKLAQASSLNHVESVSMMYDRITWHYLDGNIKYTDSWNERE
ncbi:type VI secretion system tube protein TssD [Paraburkholderia sp. 32]|uniref:type VI secretion system tube protein TssD n=1 Tax=Paraburkholderia sp. 32 TaxID=2991057 RepID=UPI003D1A0E1A